MTGMKNIRPIESLVQDDNYFEESIPFRLWGGPAEWKETKMHRQHAQWNR